MQATFFVLLPLSVIVLFIGGMMGVMSILARAHRLLLATGLLLLCGSELPLLVLDTHRTLKNHTHH